MDIHALGLALQQRLTQVMVHAIIIILLLQQQGQALAEVSLPTVACA
jgi:hypothetical protein